MHVAWKGRFEPGPARPPITLARVGAQVASRLGGAPRFRMRLAFPPAGFAAPVWVDAEGFDLRRHVVALSADDEVLARLGVRRAGGRGALSAARPLPSAVGDPPRPAARGRQRRARDEDPPRDGRREVGAGRRAAAARPRSERARACAASRGLGRGSGARTGSAGGRSAGRVGGGAAARAGASGARGGLPASARRDAAAGGARGRGGRGALGSVLVPQPGHRAAADARRAHRGRSSGCSTSSARGAGR